MSFEFKVGNEYQDRGTGDFYRYIGYITLSSTIGYHHVMVSRDGRMYPYKTLSPHDWMAVSADTLKIADGLQY